MKWKLEDSKLVYGVGGKDLYYLDITEEGKLELVLEGQRISFEKIIDAFKEKTVTVRGQVVKVNMDIMDRNWVHLVDGTKGTDKSDLTFTTLELVKVGDTVVFKGVLAIGREFGAGYVYPLIVEEAVLIE